MPDVLSMSHLSEVLDPLRISLLVASLATLCVTPPAAAVGLLLARRNFPGRRLVETLVELPLVLPPTAVGLALLLLFGRRGPLGAERLAIDLGVLFTWRGAVIAAAVMSFPLVARTARVAFEAIDPRLELMGATLGLGRWQVLRRITLPLARRGLCAAALLGFSRALGEFGATTLVAGSIPGETQTLALAIYQDIQLGHDTRALVLLAVAVALAFVSISLVGRLLDRDGSRNAGRAS